MWLQSISTDGLLCSFAKQALVMVGHLRILAPASTQFNLMQIHLLTHMPFCSIATLWTYFRDCNKSRHTLNMLCDDCLIKLIFYNIWMLSFDLYLLLSRIETIILDYKDNLTIFISSNLCCSSQLIHLLILPENYFLASQNLNLSS